MVSIGGGFSQTFSFSLPTVARVVSLSPMVVVNAMPSLPAPTIWRRFLRGSCFQLRSRLYASVMVFSHWSVFYVKSLSRFSKSLPYRLRSVPRMKVQAKYCSLAYFSAALNAVGVAAALVTGALAVASVVSINPLSYRGLRHSVRWLRHCFGTSLGMLDMSYSSLGSSLIRSTWMQQIMHLLVYATHLALCSAQWIGVVRQSERANPRFEASIAKSFRLATTVQEPLLNPLFT